MLGAILSHPQDSKLLASNGRLAHRNDSYFEDRNQERLEKQSSPIAQLTNALLDVKTELELLMLEPPTGSENLVPLTQFVLGVRKDIRRFISLGPEERAKAYEYVDDLLQGLHASEYDKLKELFTKLLKKIESYSKLEPDVGNAINRLHAKTMKANSTNFLDAVNKGEAFFVFVAGLEEAELEQLGLVSWRDECELRGNVWY